jgi:serine/threonine protein kinase
MTPERWQKINELFQSASERPADERAAFLDAACAGDTELRQEVESLLACQDAAATFFENPVPEAAFAGLGQEQEAVLPGRRIGPYQVLREIGRGGMGAVYLAERADRHFRKQVAIKLIKRGMDTDAILRRFRQEEQILASLDHPTIARLLDGGTTEDGLSYFIMEFVAGQPIDVYCDAHHLSIEARLALFRTVCSAVQYAHEQHVVHRDLKPSNILVTADGVVKLLDFGIAKVLDPERAMQTTDSLAAGRPMTPEYASPEQVRGQAITPQSDVYALGVLLYELLTGHRPYHVPTRTPEAIARVICEEEPAQPSTAVSRVEEVPGPDGAESLPITAASVSAARADSPERLRRRFLDLTNRRPGWRPNSIRPLRAGESHSIVPGFLPLLEPAGPALYLLIRKSGAKRTKILKFFLTCAVRNQVAVPKAKTGGEAIRAMTVGQTQLTVWRDIR